MNRLDKIEARADAATKGPWVCVLNGDESEVTYANAPITWDDHGGEVFTEGDAEFIAAARTTVPALLDAVDNVLAWHKRIESPDGDYCDACFPNVWVYPCQTVTAITTALDGIR